MQTTNHFRQASTGLPTGIVLRFLCLALKLKDFLAYKKSEAIHGRYTLVKTNASVVAKHKDSYLANERRTVPLHLYQLEVSQSNKVATGYTQLNKRTTSARRIKNKHVIIV